MAYLKLTHASSVAADIIFIYFPLRTIYSPTLNQEWEWDCCTLDLPIRRAPPIVKQGLLHSRPAHHPPPLPLAIVKQSHLLWSFRQARKSGVFFLNAQRKGPRMSDGSLC